MGRAKQSPPVADTAPLDPNPLLTPDEAARFLGVRARTLANWRTRELGPPFVKVSTRFIMYRSADLQAWAKRNVNVPTGVDDDRRVHKDAARAAEDSQK
jgi:hypothetical protein